MTNKDIIKQYVDTGIRIPKNQFNKLSPSLLNTYLRKRIIHHKVGLSGCDEYDEEFHGHENMDELLPYEYEKMSDNNIISLMEDGLVIPYGNIYNNKLLKKYLFRRIEHVNEVNDYGMARLKDWEYDLIFKFGDVVIKLISVPNNLNIPEKYIKKLSDYNLQVYLKHRIKSRNNLHYHDLKYLVKYPNLFKVYINSLEVVEHIDQNLIEKLPEDLMEFYLIKKIDSPEKMFKLRAQNNISLFEFLKMNPRVLLHYVNSGLQLPIDQLDRLSDYLLKKYLDNRIDKVVSDETGEYRINDIASYEINKMDKDQRDRMVKHIIDTIETPSLSHTFTDRYK